MNPTTCTYYIQVFYAFVSLVFHNMLYKPIWGRYCELYYNTCHWAHRDTALNHCCRTDWAQCVSWHYNGMSMSLVSIKGFSERAVCEKWVINNSGGQWAGILHICSRQWQRGLPSTPIRKLSTRDICNLLKWYSSDCPSASFSRCRLPGLP